MSPSIKQWLSQCEDNFRIVTIERFPFVIKPFPAVEMFTDCCLSSLGPTQLVCADAFTVLVINAVSFVIKKKNLFAFILRVIMLQVKIN